MLFNHSKTQTSLNRPVVINLFSSVGPYQSEVDKCTFQNQNGKCKYVNSESSFMKYYFYTDG